MENKRKVIVGVVILAIFAVLAFTGLVDTTGRSLGTKQCTGTSGSGDIYARGTITGTQADGIKFTKTDYCSGDNPNILKEYQCDMGSQSGWSADTIYCNNGCAMGACRKGSISEGLQIF